MNMPKLGTTIPTMGMTALMPGDNLKCAANDCPSRHACYHFTRQSSGAMTWIMPINTGIDCPDFEPMEEE